jgi:PTS system mannose-specific IID component
MSSLPARLPRRVRIAVLLRSLLIQGSWNYRGMIGTGMAWAMLPILRWLARREGAGRPVPVEQLRRHAEHFNAHPYLSPVALGSLGRLEAEGVSPEAITRFRAAIRGPLGALGDRLVWAAWLPLTALLGLLLFWVGAPPWLAAVTFLVVFNLGHLRLRVRGLDAGWDQGLQLATRLRGEHLVERANTLGAGVALLTGLLVGVLLSGPAPLDQIPSPWLGVLVVGFVFGLIVGPRAWRPAALITVAGITLLILAGALGLIPLMDPS